MSARPSTIPHLLRAIVENKHVPRPPLKSIPLSNGAAHQTRRISTSTRHSSGKPDAVKVERVTPRLKPTRVELSFLPQNAAPSRLWDEQSNDRSNSYRDPKRFRRYLVVTASFATIVGAYIAYGYVSYQKDVEWYAARSKKLLLHEDVSDRWHDASRNFDREVEDSELFMGLRAKRKRLIRDSYGDVLEVSVGTGRNMDLYDTRPYSATEDAQYGRSRRHMITSLTFNDQSPVMVRTAQKKWTEKQSKKSQVDRFQGKVNWIVGDAGEPGVIQRPPGGYDTIVQSMGICSMANPVDFLRHLNTLCRQPGEPLKNASTLRMQAEEASDGKGGRIFLLEHGRSYFSWLNSLLDNAAPMHADRYGCWFNKDIGKVIEESGLTVERVKRYHFGTTWEVVLRPNPKLLSDHNVRKHSATVAADVMPADRTTKSHGWFSGIFT